MTTNSVTVDYTPQGATSPIRIPGTWYTDGGNGPGNNFPNLQLDDAGNAGFSGVSARNGADLVFRPDLDAFPVNFAAFDPFDPTCPLTDPPRKGNQGFPRGQAITVTFVPQGGGVTDTAGNRVPIGSPLTSFTFFTEPLPDPVYAPERQQRRLLRRHVRRRRHRRQLEPHAVHRGSEPVAPAELGRAPEGNSNDPSSKIVRVDVEDLKDMTTDTRPYTSFYTLLVHPARARDRHHAGQPVRRFRHDRRW